MQYKTLALLGRQPAIGLAELESLFGSEDLRPLTEAALLKTDFMDIDGSRLGGSLKLAKVLHILPTTNWTDIRNYLTKNIPLHLKHIPEGKLTIGLSAYGFRLNPSEITATTLEIKKVVKRSGRPVRVVPNKEPELNTAQVLHNNLTDERGWELIALADGHSTIIAQTFFVQDIEAYANRDQRRPKRDAKVGMLPPKLAQILVNLANPVDGMTLLDPFCGTGVLLQETALMNRNFKLYGSDIEPRMIDYTKTNLEWLRQTHKINFQYHIEVGDATTQRWQQPIDVVVAEVYLGRPFASLPDPELLTKAIREANTIFEAFVKNITAQLSAGSRLVLAVPAWRLTNYFRHLPALDRLTEMGYNRMSFVHARNSELIYHRPDQVVARELVILEKK